MKQPTYETAGDISHYPELPYPRTANISDVMNHFNQLDGSELTVLNRSHPGVHRLKNSDALLIASMGIEGYSNKWGFEFAPEIIVYDQGFQSRVIFEVTGGRAEVEVTDKYEVPQSENDKLLRRMYQAYTSRPFLAHMRPGDRLPSTHNPDLNSDPNGQEIIVPLLNAYLRRALDYDEVQPRPRSKWDLFIDRVLEPRDSTVE